MKVKVKRCKKSPAPLLSERMLLKTVVSSRPNLYSAVLKALNGSTFENIRNNVSSFGVPEVCVVDDYPNQQVKEAMKRVQKVKKELSQKKAEPFLIEDVGDSRHLNKTISEVEFITIVDKLYELAHRPRVQNAKARVFPDLKILEYQKLLNEIPSVWSSHIIAFRKR